MKTIIDNEISALLLRNVSAGLAIFNGTNKILEWCNSSFKKQTWFGGAQGGKLASRVELLDLFDKKEHKIIQDLFNITLQIGQAYDFQRLVRRGPIASFPAELRFHRIDVNIQGEILICLEITDLSLNNLYDELQIAYSQMRERIAEFMTIQAELQYSIRMNAVSEFGADLAHYLINPVTMCMDILKTQIEPTIKDSNLLDEFNNVMKYLKNIENFAVWFRKFSNPRMSETQVCNIVDIIEDTLLLNQYKFSKQFIQCKIRKLANCNPFILSVPANLIIWLNAIFNEILQIILSSGTIIYIDISIKNSLVQIYIHTNVKKIDNTKFSGLTIENLTKRLFSYNYIDINISENNITLLFEMHSFSDIDINDENIINNKGIDKNKEILKTNIKTLESNNNSIDKPLILIVDDEKDIRKLLKRTFKFLEIDTIEAEDGFKALELFQKDDIKDIKNKVNLIISDIRMPKMTGPHLLISLRNLGFEQPFVFFSSNLAEKMIDNNFKYQNVYYLTKERGIDELKEIVKKISCYK